MALRLFAALVLGGVALGYLAARQVDAFAFEPVVATVWCCVATVLLAVALRKFEFLQFAIASSLFAYATFLGMSIVRAIGSDNVAVNQIWVGPWAAGSIQGITPVVLLVGIAYAFAVTALAALPAWTIAQRFDRRQPNSRDDEIWQFIDAQTGGHSSRR